MNEPINNYQKYKEKILANRRKNYVINPPPKPNPRSRKNTVLKYKYGVTIEQYEELLKKQNEVCAICKEKTTKALHLDHCHTSGKIRGLLCFSCNSSLGKLKESQKILQNAIDYLKEYE